MAATAALLVVACKGEKKDDSPQAGKTAAGGGSKADAPRPSERGNYQSFRPLLAEAARAELDVGGQVIDFGTADQHKYTRGGWRNGWGDSANESGVSFARVTSRRARLSVLIDRGPVAEVVVRARSKASGQKITVYAGGKPLGTGEVAGVEWSLVRIPLTLEPGRHDIQLDFPAQSDVRADLDWMWLARKAGEKEPMIPPRVLPSQIGGRPKRSLVAPTARTYSYFLQPPKDAVLITDYGSTVGSSFKVTAQSDGGEPVELWSSVAKDDWQEAVVDLSSVAGKAVKLSLVVEGGSGEGATGWGEPEIMVTPTERPEPGTRPKNVIVILIDTVRADSFEAHSPGNKVVTPVYDQLAVKSTVFRNAYNQENWTKPSVATTLSGTYPATHDTKTDGAALPKEVELLSEHLKAEGFATAGFVANGYVSGKFGFEKGWDVFKNYIRESKPSEAEHVYKDALEWLNANKDKRFFLYIQTIDPHVVYRVEREFTSHYFDGDYSGPLGPTVAAEEQIALGKGSLKASERDLQWLKALYWGETTYHDTHMGTFLEELEKQKIFDDTVLVVTNDHGEELGDHGKFGHGHSLFEELIRAPLLFYYPKIFKAENRTEVVENVDVAPTIADLVGAKPMSGADGMSLLPLIEGTPPQRPYYSVTEFLDSRRASRVGDYKLIVSSGDYVGFYKVTEDPGEQKDLKDELPIARRMVEVTMGEGLAAPDKTQRMKDIAAKRQFEAGQADIDPEMRKQLEALGYFGE